MKKRCLGPRALGDFIRFLENGEKSRATVEKYTRDVRCFLQYLGGRVENRVLVLDYKAELGHSYAVRSANSMLAALNAFLRFCGRQDLCVKQFRVQREAFSPAEKELTREEYLRLLAAAKRSKQARIGLILQTLCSTGIRVSELAHITAEAVRRGDASVRCKGKTRRIFLVPELRQRLARYAEEQGIRSGPIFLTKNRRPISRFDIWKAMKALCKDAEVAPEKVFPHNLRHLFARTFYGIEKDIAKLADILGHTSIDTTRIYIATTCTEHRKKMELLHLIV